MPDTINRAIRAADFFVPVLSEAYNASEWGGVEVATALRRKADRRRLLILPVRIDRSVTPQALHNEPVIELADDFEAGFRRIAEIVALIRTNS